MTEGAALALSVIVPTRDRRQLLERKLRALEQETTPEIGPDFEVVVVADACTDDTEAFLEAYRPPYPLTWLRGPGRHAAVARNLGAERARGQVLLFSDDDVIAPLGWIEENRLLHELPNRVGLSRQVLPDHVKAGDTVGTVQGWWNFNARSASMRADAFEAVGGFDTAFDEYGGKDPDLAYRLWRRGATFHLLSGVSVVHHDESYLNNLESKGRAAGRAHVRVWRKHGDPKVGLALGVHPLSLALKRLVLHRGLAARLGHRYRWELAYMEGAIEALRGERTA